MAFAKIPYTPLIYPQVLEAHAWTPIESIPYDIVGRIEVDSAGALWLGARNAIIHYNGERIETHAEALGLAETGSFHYSINESETGELFALSDKRFLKYHDGSWHNYGPNNLPPPRQFWWSNADFYARHGALWSVSGKQVLRVTKSDYSYFDLADKPIHSFVIDSSGHFWILERSSGSVRRYAYENNKFVELNVWRKLIKHAKDNKLVLLNNDTIWLFNSDPNQAPMWIDTKEIVLSGNRSPKWNLENYSSHEPAYSDLAVVSTNDGDLIIWNKSHINLKQDDEWVSKPLSELGMEGNLNTAVTSKDGAIWVLENRKSVKRLDVNSHRQKTYLNLMMACEDKNRQYFLHRDGDVIVRELRTENWWRYTESDGVISVPTNILCSSSGDVLIYGSDGSSAAFSYLLDRGYESGSLKWGKQSLETLGGNIGSQSAIESHAGDIYFGKDEEGISKPGFIAKLSRESKQFGAKYNISYLAIPEGRVADFAELDSGRMAFSSFELSILDNTEVKPQPFPEHILSVWVDGISSDSKNNLWIATSYYGALLFDGAEWKEYSQNDGLSGDSTSYIFENVDKTVIALSTNGVDWFDGTVWQALDIYGVKAIREGSSLREAGHSIWVNQYSRDWAFRFQVREQDSESRFFTTEYRASRLAPQVDVFMDKTPFTKGEAGSENVQVSWRGRDRWFETPSEKLHFSYRINDGKWSEYSTQKTKLYSNLSAGIHHVDVRARDGDGNVSEIESLPIHIRSYFWQTGWFYVAMSVVFIIMLGSLIALLIQRVKQAEYINQSRMRFLTNISHELRNPLSLIISPLEEISNEKTNISNDHILLALRNARKLKKLVDELLEYRNLKAGNIQLKPRISDLILVVKLIVNDLHYFANQKGQNLVLVTTLDSYFCKFDIDAIAKIVENLISNALKYTDSGKTITVNIFNPTEGGIVLSVEDEGVGISANARSQLFDPFYTERFHQLGDHSSFGVGLALVKDLVELCDGHITVISPPPGKKNGTLFQTEFPSFTKGSLQTSGDQAGLQMINAQSSEAKEITPSHKALDKPNPDQQARVLIVDDNAELAEFFYQSLSEEYKCQIAHDGVAALQIAKASIPDLVISDLRMPNMDGFELCDALKNEVETSHIPILILSAHASESLQLKGLLFGAIDYILKPISIPILKSRINSLLKCRAEHAEYVLRQLDVPHKAPVDQFLNISQSPQFDSHSLSDTEALFLERIHTLLINKYSNANFNAEQMANEIHMSRSALYRKFKALTNITPAEYIKTYRLNAAKSHIINGYSVSDTIKKVGFSDLSSFSRMYKSYFGVPPSEQKIAINNRKSTNSGSDT